jgi:hypothetical protein
MHQGQSKPAKRHGPEGTERSHAIETGEVMNKREQKRRRIVEAAAPGSETSTALTASVGFPNSLLWIACAFLPEYAGKSAARLGTITQR